MRCLVLFALLTLVACGPKAAAIPAGPPSAQGSSGYYWRDVFAQMVEHMTTADVRRRFGPPTLTQSFSTGDREEWYYAGLTVDRVTGRVDRDVQISFEHAVETDVNFYP